MQARFKLIISLMNLLRLLLIALAVWIIVVLIRNRRSRQSTLKNQQDDHQAVDRIVPCSVCGTHVPEGEAIHEAGKVYCSPEHRDQAKNTGN
jgi:uncharacterized protein